MAYALRPTRPLLLATLALGTSCSDSKPGPSDLSHGHPVPPPTVAADDICFLREEQTSDGLRRTLLTARSAAPGPQGTHLFAQPKVTIDLGRSGRSLQLAAPKASFTMPRQEPRDGLFTAEPGQPVVLTLTETIGQTTVERLKVFFDESARFDVQSDEIRTDGPVHVTGPEIDFRGRGLQLVWNRGHQRIESLEINHGEILRYHAAPIAKTPVKTAANTPTEPQPPPQESKGGSQRPPPTSAYHLWLEENVRATMDAPKAADRVTMEAAEVIGCFALEAPNKSTPATAPARRASRMPGLGEGTLQVQPISAPGAAPATPATPADQRSLFKASDHDLTLTWHGRLKLTPAEADDIPGDLRLLGTDAAPALVRDGEGGAIAATTLRYTQSTGRVQATGTETRPVVIQSPGKGTLSGRSLDLTPATGKAILQGPGRLEAMTAAVNETKAGDSNAAKPNGKPVPTPLRAAYNDQLEATFTPTSATSPKLGAIQSLHLRGQVQASQDDFILACDQLDLPMTEATAKQPPRPREVLASGGVRVQLRDPNPKAGTIQVESQTLQLTLREDKGVLLPAQLTAHGAPETPIRVMQGVTTTTPNGTTELTCSTLEAALTTPARPGERPTVARLHARTNVACRTLVNKETAHITADQLVAEPRSGALQILGELATEKPASIVGSSFALVGGDIRLTQAIGATPSPASASATPGQLEVQGPGTLDLQLGDKASQRIGLSWTEGMRFDDTAGNGHFSGDVHVDSRGATSATRLAAPGGLDLWISARDAKGQRNLRGLVAEGGTHGKVALTTEDTDRAGTLVHRLHLQGPKLEVQEDPATHLAGPVRIPGAGLLQLENYTDANEAAANPVSGRGATVFTWSKLLTVSQAGQAQLQNDVEMRHRPCKPDSTALDAENSAEFKCQQLTAEFDGLSGLGTLASPAAKSKTTQLRSLALDYGVVFRQPGRRINCDHLKYGAVEQTLLLAADPPRVVEIEDGTHNNFSARRARFDLKNQTSEILEGAGR